MVEVVRPTRLPRSSRPSVVGIASARQVNITTAKDSTHRVRCSIRKEHDEGLELATVLGCVARVRSKEGSAQRLKLKDTLCKGVAVIGVAAGETGEYRR